MILRIQGIPYAYLAVAWMAVIYFLSSRPGSEFPATFDGADKIVHFVVFGILGVLLAGAFGRVGREFPWRRLLLVTTAVALYGVLDEFHQAFVPGRAPSAGDVVADAAGGFVVTAVAYRFWLPARQAEAG